MLKQPKLNLTARHIAAVIVLIGALLVAGGVALVYLPAGIICGGVELLALGLFAVDVDGGVR